VIGGRAWPRLPRTRALELQLALMGTPLEQARLAGRLAHPSTSADETYDVAAQEDIARLQADLRAVADDRGWPRSLDGIDTAELDRAWGRVLYRGMAIVPVDASREGVWSFLALVVVPDLARWRFPGTTERFIGVTDHVFGRLWWREFVLGAELIDGDGHEPLTEPELVALFRRTDLVASRSVAQAIARVVLRSGVFGAERLALMKRLVLELLHLTPGVCLDALDDEALGHMIGRLRSSALGSDPAAGRA
jgi:hypothetical protein